MRRIGILTLATAASLAAFAPAPAPAANECIGKPSAEACEEMARDIDPRAGALVHYATHPDEIIVCVRECGPPTD
jgi:hypothetical protein